MSGPLFGNALLMLALGGLTGCQTLGTTDADHALYRIQTVDSHTARVQHVTARATARGLELRGSVSRSWPRRGPIHGHVDIYIEGSGGVTSALEGVRYQRPSRKSTRAWFHESVDARVPEGSIIRIVHHDSGWAHGT